MACVLLVQYHIIKHVWRWGCQVWWAGGITWPPFSETSTDMPVALVLFNQKCLLVHWKSKSKATWPIPLNQTCQLTLYCMHCYIFNTKYMRCRQLLCCCICNIYACWSSVTATNTAAVQTCLLYESCWNMDTCWTVATQSICMPADLLPLSILPLSILPLILRVWCLTISRACWCGVLL